MTRLHINNKFARHLPGFVIFFFSFNILVLHVLSSQRQKVFQNIPFSMFCMRRKKQKKRAPRKMLEQDGDTISLLRAKNTIVIRKNYVNFFWELDCEKMERTRGRSPWFLIKSRKTMWKLHFPGFHQAEKSAHHRVQRWMAGSWI